MINTSSFEVHVFYEFNKQTNEKKVIFVDQNMKNIHTVKYRTRKIKPQEGVDSNA